MTMTLPALRDDAVLPEPDEEGFGALRSESGSCLPLVAMSYTTEVTGLTANLTVRQTFRNSHDEPVETAYIFPLPARAAVTGFVATLGGRRIVGRLDERGAARATYDAAISSGHRAAIAEEERPEVFTTRVGNLQPGEEAVIELVLASQLPYEDGEVTLRLPLVVGPRYVPGTPLDGASVGTGTSPDTDQVPDASRITPPALLPGMPNPVTLNVAVSLDPAGMAVSDLRSSLHALAEGAPAEGPIEAPVTVSLPPGERLDRDFILRWRVAEAGVTSAFAAAPGAKGEDGAFVALVVPPAKGVGADRDVVVVVDRSTSMGWEGGEWKMVSARRGAARIIDSLGAADRFQAIAFDFAPQYLGVASQPVASPNLARYGIVAPPAAPALLPGTDRNRFKIVEALAQVRPQGGTESVAALTEGFRALRPAVEGRERCMVFVTDGQVANEAGALQVVAANPGVRMFVVGIGSEVNAGLLQRLASISGGHFELVESEDRLDEVMAAMLRRISTPILRNVTIEARGFEIVADTLSPQAGADAFEGVPLVIRGRYRGNAKGSVTIKGLDRSGQTVELKAKVTTTANSALAPVWARARLRDMEDDYEAHPHAPNRKSLMAEIVQTSLAHGVLCRFTAFVAVDEDEKVAVGTRTVTQPVESPMRVNSLRMAMPTSSPASFGGGLGVVSRGGGLTRGSDLGGGGDTFGSWGTFDGGFETTRMDKSIGGLIPKGVVSVSYDEQAKTLVGQLRAELGNSTVMSPAFDRLVRKVEELLATMRRDGKGGTHTAVVLTDLLDGLSGVRSPSLAMPAVAGACLSLGVKPTGPAAPATPAPAAARAPREDFWKQ